MRPHVMGRRVAGPAVITAIIIALGCALGAAVTMTLVPVPALWLVLGMTSGYALSGST